MVKFCTNETGTVNIDNYFNTKINNWTLQYQLLSKSICLFFLPSVHTSFYKLSAVFLVFLQYYEPFNFFAILCIYIIRFFLYIIYIICIFIHNIHNTYFCQYFAPFIFLQYYPSSEFIFLGSNCLSFWVIVVFRVYLSG